MNCSNAARMASRSRGRSPEVCQRAEGARAPKRCDLYLVRQPFGARVRLLAVPRVQHRRQRAFGPTRRLLGRRVVVVQDRGRLRGSNVRAAPLREGRPCVPLLEAHSLDRLPRNLRRAILATTLRTESNAASTGHRPCPASDAGISFAGAPRHPRPCHLSHHGGAMLRMDGRGRLDARSATAG